MSEREKLLLTVFIISAVIGFFAAIACAGEEPDGCGAIGCLILLVAAIGSGLWFLIDLIWRLG